MSTTSDPRLGILIAAMIMGSLVLILCAMQCCGCRGRWRDDLHAPLLDDADRRADAAMREAKAGCNVCAACGFDNFKHCTWCVVCGHTISQASDGKEENALGMEPSERQLHCSSIDDGLPPPSSRQRRARRRKEWQRKIDIHGHAFWFRNAIPDEEHRWTGYVVQWVQQPDRNEGHPLSSRQPRTLEEMANFLQQQLSSSTFRIVEAAHVDPMQTAFGDVMPLDISARDIVSMATKNFPTKYASFLERTAKLQVCPYQAHYCLAIDRNRVYQDTIEALCAVHPSEVRAAIRVCFVEETGIDAGALHREWLELIMRELVDPATGILRCMDKSEQSWMLSSQSFNDVGDTHLAHCFVVGRLLGRVLLEGNVTGFHLALPLLKIILGVPVSFSDLQFVDPGMYKNLMWMLEQPGAEALGLDFSVTKRVGDNSVVDDLVPNGRDKAVTDKNKVLYADLLFRHVVFDSVSPQLYALLKGIYEVIPPSYLMMLDPEELDVMIAGMDTIDVDDWERETVSPTKPEHQRVVRWFWEIIRKMPEETRRRLLLFSTGSSRMPLAGFAALTSYDGRLCPFTLKVIEGRRSMGGYVVSHACFNHLDIPHSATREELETVLLATLSTDLYGFTTN